MNAITPAERVAFFIDDDALLVQSITDLLDATFRAHNVKLKVITSTHIIENTIESLRNKSNVVMVVLDLWLLDKSTNTPDHNGGLKILQLLRATWPNCYVIVYSGHLDQAIKASLKQFEQIAIVDKPVPAWVLTELIDNILVAKEV